MKVETIGLQAARRIALAAQGFGQKRPVRPTPAHLRRTLESLHLHQIDSVNVLTRAHYLPAFSCLGRYDRTDLDRLAWGPKPERKLFEYWAHEASLLPFEDHPFLRWRMAAADRGEAAWTWMRHFASQGRREAMALLARIRSDGQMSAADSETRKGQSGSWQWSDTKRTRMAFLVRPHHYGHPPSRFRTGI